MKAYLRITVEVDVEVPDGLSYEEAYKYILDNYQDDITLAIKSGDCYMEAEFP